MTLRVVAVELRAARMTGAIGVPTTTTYEPAGSVATWMVCDVPVKMVAQPLLRTSASEMSKPVADRGTRASPGASYREVEARILERDSEIAELLVGVRRIAVLGMKTEAQAGQPAFYVPEYLARVGYDIVPVPVYYPEVTSILGRKVYRRVAEVPGGVDLVDVFRRSRDLAPHLDDLIAARPRAVWLQSGIRDDAFAARLVEAGISVVQDECLMVEVRHRGLRPR